MKHLLITTIAVVLVVGCGESQQSAPAPEAKPEPPTAKAPDISIHKATTSGNIEAVKQHLGTGTDVNAKDGYGSAPLHAAVRYGRKEVAELLIANGVDVNAKDKDGGTPLHHAAWDGVALKEVVELLIAKGANVNAKIEGGSTPLHYAAKWGHNKSVINNRKAFLINSYVT
jgi:ankyrin repeat protein